MRITGGVARGARLVVPRSSPVRPTSDRVRAALFQLLGGVVVDARVLDLFAGTGALGLEALSRGAAWADFVERDARLCQAIRQNLAAAGFAQQGRVYRARVERALEFLQEPYQVVLVDPPYDLPGLQGLLERLGESRLVAAGAVVVVEHRSRATLAPAPGALVLARERRYGDTALAFYTALDRSTHDDSPLRRDL
ncbi:MAG: 16S rRNA (guanine(966)-N(2))-methyltransferase RsmD [Chloroflexi bacterium]|nr:16S rRNA (guanine(966)-N(2))-methyltransferase RsmD [Chloroflexota bacterium]